jgi:hypothetical protein
MSRSRATSTGGIKHGRDWPSVDSGPAGPRPAEAGSTPAPRGPEWKTQRWKLQVEAEARSRLKKIIRKVGSDR